MSKNQFQPTLPARKQVLYPRNQAAASAEIREAANSFHPRKLQLQNKTDKFPLHPTPTDNNNNNNKIPNEATTTTLRGTGA